MSNLVRFEKVDNELNILRIGGKSFLPPDVEWPTNPNGEKMVFISVSYTHLTLPTILRV